MTVLKQVSWGDGLVVATFKSPGGMKVAVDRIHKNVGTHIGVRNTFAKLLHVDDPANLNERDRLRAWLLVTALGLNPDDWSLSDSDVPPVYNIEALRAALCVTPDPDGTGAGTEKRLGSGCTSETVTHLRHLVPARAADYEYRESA